MSTNIGEVSISLRLSMAKFQSDVQQGTGAVQQSSAQLGEAVSEGTGKAKESLRLLSEEIGVHLPRGLNNFIAELPGIGTALNAAFSSVAILALIEVITKIVEKVQEFRAHAKELQDALAASGEAGAESLGKLNEKILDVDKQFDELIGDKLGALRIGLKQIDDARMDQLTGQLKAVGQEMDSLITKMQVSWWANLFGQGDNKGVEMVKTQADAMLATLKDVKVGGNLQEYGKQLGFMLTSARAAADQLGNTTQVQQAWQDVTKQIELLQAEFQKTNIAADGMKLNTSVAAANAEVEKMENSIRSVGNAWLEMQSSVATESTDPTAELAKHLDDALSAIQKFGIVAQGVWSAVDIGAAKASATDRAYANELKELMELTSQFQALNRNVQNPTLNVPQISPTVVENMSSLQRELQAVAAGGNVADEVTQRVVDAQETLKQKVKETQQELVALFSQGRINAQQYIKGLEQADAELQTHNKDWTKLGTTIGQSLNEFAEGSQKWTKSLEDVGIQMAELVIKMTLLKNLQSDDSFFGQLASGILSGISGRAEGGPVAANVPYWVGERKTPELFVPSVPGHIVPMSQIGEGGGGSSHTTVNMQVSTPDANSFGKSQAQIMSDLYREARVASAQNRGR